MKEKNTEQKTTDLQMNLDLERQRTYVNDLEERQFEYGLVLANAFVKGMRDIGYKSTATALNELIDNAIQADARKIHITFGFTGNNTSEKKPDTLAVIDDGHGMDPMMIRAAVIWGGTHRHNDRTGFGRYGYGLPSACVSIGKRYTIFSKVVGGDWHKVAVDLDEIEDHFNKGQGPVVAPKPIKATPPTWVELYIRKTFSTLESGTVVLIDKVDRLEYWTAQRLGEFLLENFGVTYRNFLNQVTLAVTGTTVQPTDPLFLTPGFRFYDIDDDRAVALPPLAIEVKDKNSKEAMGTIKVRFSYMPPTFLRFPEHKMKAKGGKNNNNERLPIRKENNGIIVLRAGRQIDVVNAKCPWTVFQTNDRYVGVEVDFPPSLDEEFSITTSKQQVGLKQRIWDILEENGVYDAIEKMRSDYTIAANEIRVKATDKDGKRPSEVAIEKSQKFFTQAPNEPTPEQKKKSEENLDREAKKLAEETDIPTEDARKLLEGRATNYPFKVKLEDMPGAPFYRLDQVGGQKMLFLNKAHRFFADLYASAHSTPHVRYALETLLFVMGECELRAKDERRTWYEAERALWSTNLSTGLKALEEWDTSEDDSSSTAEL